MADLPKSPAPAPAGATPPARAGGAPKPKQKFSLNEQQFPKSKRLSARLARGAGKAASAVGAVGPLIPGIGGKIAGALGGALSAYVGSRQQPTGAPAPGGGDAAPGAGAPGGTEAKLAALLGGDAQAPDVSKAGPVGAGGPQSVAVGAKVIAGVLVTPEAYDSETGPRLAVAARVFGMANALELAVLRLIDLPAGQLLTYAMNRGFR